LAETFSTSPQEWLQGSTSNLAQMFLMGPNILLKVSLWDLQIEVKLGACNFYGEFLWDNTSASMILVRWGHIYVLQTSSFVFITVLWEKEQSKGDKREQIQRIMW